MAQMTTNGIGRYICQLKRLTLNYCRLGGSSKGMRDFIDKQIVPLAEQNPQVAVYIKHRPWHHPRLVGVYLDGSSKIVCVKNLESEAVARHVSLMLTSSTAKAVKLRKWWHTNRASIQGNWNPFLNH